MIHLLNELVLLQAGDAEWTTVRVGASRQSNQADSEVANPFFSIYALYVVTEFLMLQVHEASSLIENLEASSTYEALVQVTLAISKREQKNRSLTLKGKELIWLEPAKQN